MIRPNESKEGETPQAAIIEDNPAMKKRWESEIKILRDAPRDEKKLREILKAKQKEYEKAEDGEDIERLVTEIEMIKFVLFLVCRNIKKKNMARHILKLVKQSH